MESWVPPPVVRPIRPDEHARAATVVLAAYADLGLDLGPYRASLADVAGRASAADVLVAVAGGRMLGTVTYVDGSDNAYAEFDDDDAAGMRMLAVDPAAQCRGVGAALVETCIDRARAGGRRVLVLHTTAVMDAARQLYERRGFRRAPARDWSPEPHVHLQGYELVVGAAAPRHVGRTVGS